MDPPAPMRVVNGSIQMKNRELWYVVLAQALLKQNTTGYYTISSRLHAT
jgi:hypothetical protein